MLVNNILQSFPIYLMSAMNPPKGMIDQMHKIMAKFFCSKTGGIKGKHLVPWEDLCLLIEEGGLLFQIDAHCC